MKTPSIKTTSVTTPSVTTRTMKLLRGSVMAAVVGGVLAGGPAWDRPVWAAESAASPLQVQAFRYLDKESDRISLDKTSEPDGTRDGHLSLRIDAGEGTEIKSITLKTADSAGRDINHGQWKSWKAQAGEIGHLLAVVRDGKILNTTFQPTLGTFKGIAEFELYASDNNSMKPGEYYYVELETSKGTVKSEVTPFADSETSYAPVVIREFASVDLNQDKTGSAVFEADGGTDGHFKLKLHLAPKTEVLAMILRPTDKEGKEAYQGIWRTNRAGVGWLLGIAKGDTVVTPEFKKDVKEPLGTFSGPVAFDLYANNNGSIKNGQYYTVEIETTYGTVISKPIQFGNAASNYKDDTALDFRTIALTLDSRLAAVDEVEQTLEVAPFTLEGRTMVPIRFIGEALGAKVDWNASDRRVTLAKEGVLVELVIDGKNAKVNGEEVLLDAPAVIRDGITLVPVRFVSESMKMKVFFDNGEILITDALEQ
ncbi:MULTISPECIES: copper amine oxidase N-terminal domain-containing protein [Paenibacillus]|uniref:copper amine oxidase N-terminal domain-containing protein n=1 Tax=Paenibacillus TaxID=44249 RepID=UPI0022B92705|nr:copper amine oxidase N-terminal domain-containing protein [Paenibacillus caseinilyticus]MCZ8519780.1 copper amine oxidase N-terminal domain-containing protein [Paenibacillus caseinilyticus]